MNKNRYRLGIIGTGRIANRFVPEARFIEGIEITAVYNPRLSSAEKFAEELNIAYATDDIISFVEQVDAVYIATPHETHVDYSRQMLQAGKHVLCEKPMSFSKKDAEELFVLAEEKHLVLMEAMKTAYCPGFKGLLEVVKSGKIGQIIDVEACFSRLSASNVREVWDKKYGGSFTEFGTYPLLPIVKLLGTNDIASRTWARQAKNGIDVYTKTTIDYGYATALAKTGLAVKSEGQLVIAGTKGYVLVPSPWWLTKYFEVHYEDPNKIEKYEFTYEGQGLRYEVREFVTRMNWMDAQDELKENGINHNSDEERNFVMLRAREENLLIDNISVNSSLTAEESIWFAEKMEEYLQQGRNRDVLTGGAGNETRETEISEKSTHAVNIWAHRGCSFAYPENTLSAFRAAAELHGITGIELDVQLTKDNEMVVIHDETIDRTTNGTGNVRDFTLEELQALEIKGKDGEIEHIPTMEEVFILLKEYCFKKGLLINIELKNSKIRYEGMEQQLLDMVSKYGLEQYIVYSSFLPESMRLLKELDASVRTGILGVDEAWCREKMIEMHADAIHPWNGGLEFVGECEKVGALHKSREEDELKEIDRRGVNSEEINMDCPVRVWNGEEPFFGQNRILRERNMTKYAKLGATDMITNVPEMYL